MSESQNPSRVPAAHLQRVADVLSSLSSEAKRVLDENATLWAHRDVVRLCEAYTRLELVAKELRARAAQT